jgi:phosphoribosylaminoimidazole-succinocarboxamide synthase
MTAPIDAQIIHKSQLTSLQKLNTGKVRDNYLIDEQYMLMVTTDRLSAFDVVMTQPIPYKGLILTQMSLFWFDYLSDIIPNHLTNIPLTQVLNMEDQKQAQGRSLVVKRLKPILVEAVVRGYMAGSAWKEYQSSQSICGIQLPEGLANAQALPKPIFTPAAKADVGEHDENISFENMCERIGEELAHKIRDVSLALYAKAHDYALTKGIIIADTKFEFGLDENNQLVLMDEVLTPDSSRFWPLAGYNIGISPPSYDKQFVRDWLECQPWNKEAPAPDLPLDVIIQTQKTYEKALHELTGQGLQET